jgi:hypothetical protein
MLLFPIEFKKKEELVQGENEKKFDRIELDYKPRSAGGILYFTSKFKYSATM